MMKAQLAIPVPGDFCTVAHAAELIGCSQRSVRRLIAAGTLAGMRPQVGVGESGRRHTMLATAQVREYAAAYKLVRDA